MVVDVVSKGVLLQRLASMGSPEGATLHQGASGRSQVRRRMQLAGGSWQAHASEPEDGCESLKPPSALLEGYPQRLTLRRGQIRGRCGGNSDARVRGA